MSKSQSRSSAVEPDSFYATPGRMVKRVYPNSDDHFSECPNCDEPDGKNCAWCADEERHIREDFKEARCNLERDN